MRPSRTFGLAGLALLGLSLAPAVLANPAWHAVDFFSLTGGLNSSADTTSLQPNEAADLSNVIFATGGGITKRQGFDNLNTSACLSATGVITGLTFYKQSDGDRFLVGTLSDDASDKYFKMDYGGGTTGPDGTCDDITGAVSIAISDDTLSDFATAEDELIIEDGDGTTKPVKWTGSGNVSTMTSAPAASMVEFHKRILWLAGRTDARSRLDFSNLDDIDTYTATDFLLIETDDGQVITGLKSALDCLYVFKTESIWRVCGADRDNLYVEQMVRGIGAASNQSIALINNRFVFLTNQGDIAVYDGGITVQVVSSKINVTLDALAINRFPKAVAAAFDDGTGDEDYYLSLSSAGSGTHDTILLYDTFYQAWTKFSGLNVNALVPYEIGTTQKALAFADYSANILRYPLGDNDNGSAISAYWTSGHLRFPEIPFQKIFHEVQVVVRQQGSYNLTFEHRLDFEGAGTSTDISLAGTTSLWDTAVWDVDSYGDLVSAIRKVAVDRPGDFFQWKVSNAGSDQPFLVRGIRVFMESTGRVSP